MIINYDTLDRYELVPNKYGYCPYVRVTNSEGKIKLYSTEEQAFSSKPTSGNNWGVGSRV